MLRSLILIVLATLVGLTAVGAEITFRESATPTRGGLVRLGDVASIRGTDSGRLAGLPLMPKPAPGAGQLVSAQAVREMLAAQGESPQAHRFGGAYFVRVTTASDTPSLAAENNAGWRPAETGPSKQRPNAFRVRRGASTAPTPRQAASPRRLSSRETKSIEQLVAAAIQDTLDRRSSANADAPRLAVRSVELSQSTVRELLSQTDQKLEVAFSSNERLAAGSTRVRFWAGSHQSTDPYTATVELAVRPMRVVAASTMQRDSMIVASSVRLEPTPLEEIDRPRSIGFTRLEQVIGREATRPLRAGEILSENNTAPPLMVKRGEEVTVFSGGGGVSVRVRGVAKQAGRQGELVPVETLDTADKFMARVVGVRRLAVLSAGPMVAETTRTGGLR